jgi:uncharacterized membrane protein
LHLLAAILQEVQSLREEFEKFRYEVAHERAYDRKRIAALEIIEPQPLQKDRCEILRALLAANGGKMLAKEARHKMHLSKSRFSELLTKSEEWIESRPYHLNRSAKVLILK